MGDGLVSHTFIISEKPIPCARPRVTRWGAFDPQKDKTNWLKAHFREMMIEKGLEIISGPVAVYMEFNMPIPKSWSKKKIQEALGGKIHHVSRPDIDNLCKKCADVMIGTVLKDDSQIFSLTIKKQYSSDPRTFISVTEF